MDRLEIGVVTNWDPEAEVSGFADEIVRSVAEGAREAWVDEADKGLNKTKAGYINGLSVEQEDYASWSVVLRGALNVRIEQGSSAYDMKKFLLKGATSKVIPLGFSERSGEPSRASDLSKSVLHSKVPKASERGRNYKGLDYTIEKPLIGAGGSYTIESLRQKHKTRAFAGLRTNEGERAKVSDATLFRTVSTNSDPSSWIHPGIKARDFRGKVISRVDGIINNVLKGVSYG